MGGLQVCGLKKNVVNVGKLGRLKPEKRLKTLSKKVVRNVVERTVDCFLLITQ